MKNILSFLVLFSLFSSTLVEAQIRRQSQPARQPQPAARSAQQTPQNNTSNARLVAIEGRPNQQTAPAATSPLGNSPLGKSNATSTAAKGNVIPAKEELTHPQNHVLLVGVNKYPLAKGSTETLLSASFPELSFCVRDMERLAKSLVAASFCKEDDIQILVSGGSTEPTAENVLAAFEALVAKIQPNDRVLFAFSGHGIALPLEGNVNRAVDYLCCADSEVLYNVSNGKFESQQGLLRRSQIEEELDRSAAGTKLVFIDACRNVLSEMSGVLKSGEKTAGIKGLAGVRGVGDFGNGAASEITRGLFRLSSCEPGEMSQEYPGNMEHGVFTYFLIEGMLGKARQRNPGEITLADLAEYVNEKTEHFVRTTICKDPQNPTTQTPTLVKLPNERALFPERIIFSYCSYTESEAAFSESDMARMRELLTRYNTQRTSMSDAEGRELLVLRDRLLPVLELAVQMSETLAATGMPVPQDLQQQRNMVESLRSLPSSWNTPRMPGGRTNSPSPR